jgi:two-component system capsular synthesis sensor histidine kinase RcsC
MLEFETGRDKAPYPGPVPGRKRKVLVVDDNRAVQDVLSRMISLLGYDVTVAGNGVEGGTLFVTGSYDLVVTDVQMPLMNGWELSRIVKERSPKTPVIVVTGLPEGHHGEKPEKTCVDAVIPKPFRVEEFERTIQRLLK